MVEGKTILIRVLRGGPLQGVNTVVDRYLQCNKNGRPLRLGKKTIQGRGNSKCKDFRWEQAWFVEGAERRSLWLETKKQGTNHERGAWRRSQGWLPSGHGPWPGVGLECTGSAKDWMVLRSVMIGSDLHFNKIPLAPLVKCQLILTP